jgi:hypothetical protein
MALYIPHSFFHLALLFYVRPENFWTLYMALSSYAIMVTVCRRFLLRMLTSYKIFDSV